jgi:hypothetical protein
LTMAGLTGALALAVAGFLAGAAFLADFAGFAGFACFACFAGLADDFLAADFDFEAMGW